MATQNLPLAQIISTLAQNVDRLTPAMCSELRFHFDGILAEMGPSASPDTVAKVELAREWLCNPEFRRGMSDFVWNLNTLPAL